MLREKELPHPFECRFHNVSEALTEVFGAEAEAAAPQLITIGKSEVTAIHPTLPGWIPNQVKKYRDQFPNNETIWQALSEYVSNRVNMIISPEKVPRSSHLRSVVRRIEEACRPQGKTVVTMTDVRSVVGGREWSRWVKRQQDDHDIPHDQIIH